jgi:hypothetical protein
MAADSTFHLAKEIPMTIHRQRMIDDMQVRNLSPHTQASYVLQVSQFARHSTTGDDHVDVGMVGHLRAPSMQDGGDADCGPEMLGVGGNGQHGLGGGL